MGRDEAGTLAALKAHRRQLLAPKAAQYRGRTVKLMGDGALMEFNSVVDAVRFAVEVQCAMRERNAAVPEDRRILYRIGINIGDIIVEGEDIYGDGVNIAARLEGLAEPGGICIARNVYVCGGLRLPGLLVQRQPSSIRQCIRLYGSLRPTSLVPHFLVAAFCKRYLPELLCLAWSCSHSGNCTPLGLGHEFALR
jgi:class 3 adenylate cyclase